MGGWVGVCVRMHVRACVRVCVCGVVWRAGVGVWQLSAQLDSRGFPTLYNAEAMLRP